MADRTTLHIIQRIPPTTLHTNSTAVLPNDEDSDDDDNFQPNLGSGKKRSIKVVESDSDDDEIGGAAAATSDAIEATVSALFSVSVSPDVAVKPTPLSSSSFIARKVENDQQRSDSVWGFSPGAILPGGGDDFSPIIEGQTFPLYSSDSLDVGDSRLGAARAGLQAFCASVDREARNQSQDSKLQSVAFHTVSFAGNEVIRGKGTIGCGSQYRRRDATRPDADDAGGPAAAASCGGHEATMVGSVPLGVLSDEQKRSVETAISADGLHIRNSCAGRVHTNSACSSNRLRGLLVDGVHATGKAETFLKVIILIIVIYFLFFSFFSFFPTLGPLACMCCALCMLCVVLHTPQPHCYPEVKPQY